MNLKTKSTLLRLLKGTLSGTTGAILLMIVREPQIWSDFKTILNEMALAGVYGAITGLILAIQKWVTWEEIQNIK